MPQKANWLQGLRRLQAYVDQSGDAQVEAKYTTADGYRLGAWVAQQRYALRPKRTELCIPEDGPLGGRGSRVERIQGALSQPPTPGKCGQVPQNAAGTHPVVECGPQQ
ncbi:helicase associated domain-containing protein [Mycobacterium heckeshornense]|uniref:helicase associated domain-containing protein n=1 Tax=Mycobacterium heckeshornense TaxID=110505 RepID=UPI0009E28CCA|nr:helicase associated domain-containing protein [Mycobacterium heckeshornense]